MRRTVASQHETGGIMSISGVSGSPPVHHVPPKPPATPNHESKEAAPAKHPAPPVKPSRVDVKA